MERRLNTELITGTSCELKDLKSETVYTINVEAVGLDNQTSSQTTITFTTEKEDTTMPDGGETSGTPNGADETLDGGDNTVDSNDKIAGGGDTSSENQMVTVENQRHRQGISQEVGNSMMDAWGFRKCEF